MIVDFALELPDVDEVGIAAAAVSAAAAAAEAVAFVVDFGPVVDSYNGLCNLKIYLYNYYIYNPNFLGLLGMKKARL